MRALHLGLSISIPTTEGPVQNMANPTYRRASTTDPQVQTVVNPLFRPKGIRMCRLTPEQIQIALAAKAEIAADLLRELQEKGCSPTEISSMKDALLEARFNAFLATHEFVGNTIYEKGEEAAKAMEAAGLSALKDQLLQFNQSLKQSALEAIAESAFKGVGSTLSVTSSLLNLVSSTLGTTSTIVGAVGSGAGLIATGISTVVTTKRLIEASENRHSLEKLISDMRKEILSNAKESHIAEEKALFMVSYLENSIRAIAREQSSQGIIQGANAASLIGGAAAIAVAAGVAGPGAPAVILGCALVGVSLLIARVIKERIEKRQEDHRQEGLKEHGLYAHTAEGLPIALAELILEETIPANTPNGALRLEPALTNHAHMVSDILVNHLGISNPQLFIQMTYLIAQQFTNGELKTNEDRRDFHAPLTFVRMGTAVRVIQHLVSDQLEALHASKEHSPRILKAVQSLYESRCQQAYTEINTLSLRDLENQVAKNDVLRAAKSFALSPAHNTSAIFFNVNAKVELIQEIDALSKRLEKLKQSSLAQEAGSILKEAERLLKEAIYTESLSDCSNLIATLEATL